MSVPWRLVANIVFFQAGWFACLMLSSSWLTAIISAILLLHFFIVIPTANVLGENSKQVESVLLLKVVAIGFVLECLYLVGDVLVRQDGLLWPPIWLLMIWLLFATTLRYSLSWLRNKILLSSIFAAIAGPASYYAGVQLNSGMMFGSSLLFSLLAISISWGVIFPLLLRIALPLKPYGASIID